VNALTAAVDRLIEAEPRSARRCLCELELGEVLIDLGDTEAATEHLERALDLARDGDWSALAAGAYGVLSPPRRAMREGGSAGAGRCRRFRAETPRGGRRCYGAPRASLDFRTSLAPRFRHGGRL
jgi:hypothetical protein